MSMQPNDQIRASHPDRERVLEILHDALAQGRITADEYAERSAVTLAAQTMGDLRPVLADLPVGAMPSDQLPAVVGKDVVEWRGSFSSIKRKGVWQVPRRIVLHRRMGSVELDFTQAQFTSPTVEIAMDIVGGSVEIRVPEGASVSIDEVEVSFGSIEDHRKGASPSGQPHLRLTGSVRWGSAEIRGPRRWAR